MSELIAPPASWKFRLHLTAADLAAELGNHRLKDWAAPGKVAF
jgi:hypothetical protein